MIVHKDSINSILFFTEMHSATIAPSYKIVAEKLYEERHYDMG